MRQIEKITALSLDII